MGSVFSCFQAGNGEDNRGAPNRSNIYAAIFRRRQAQGHREPVDESQPLPINRASAIVLVSGSLVENSNLQQEGTVSGMQKFGVHLNKDSESTGSKNCPKFESSFVLRGFLSEYPVPNFSAEEEDVCPTCLEEYTPENPKVVAHCSHEFHLGCIYEWMERSPTCPVCGKVMTFDEL